MYSVRSIVSHIIYLQDSLVALGMPEGEKEHVINILTAILILGQIQYKTEGDGVGVRITNPAVVKVSWTIHQSVELIAGINRYDGVQSVKKSF